MKASALKALFDSMHYPKRFDRSTAVVRFGAADVQRAEQTLGRPLDAQLRETVESGVVPSTLFCFAGNEHSFLDVAQACRLADPETLAAGLWPFLCDEAGEVLWFVKHGDAPCGGQRFASGSVICQTMGDHHLASACLDDYWRACAAADRFQQQHGDDVSISALTAHLGPGHTAFINAMQTSVLQWPME